MSFSLEITGLDEFIEKIDDKESVLKAINTGIKKVVFFLEGEVKTITPVDTGVLRNSFRQSYGNLTGRLYNIRNYGMFVHEGTKFIKANPFMTITVEKSGNEASSIISDELNDSLSILQ